MSRLPLHEGFFKDIEKTIIDQDDPDYVEKDRERMFNTFKERDQKKIVQAWLRNHVFIRFTNDANYWTGSTFLNEEFEGQYYKIDWSGGADNPVIDIINVDECCISSTEDKTPFNENGELPYKFGRCDGNFAIKRSENDYVKGVIGANVKGGCLKSFKNIPNYIGGELNISDYSIGFKDNFCIADFSTLPDNLVIKGILDEDGISPGLTLYGISGLKNFTGMPNGVSIISGAISIANCPDFINLEGWNPTLNTGKSGNNVSICIGYCPRFESFKGLPDNFTCDDLYARHCGIRTIVDWPHNLNVTTELNLTGNYLTVGSLIRNPLPHDLKAEYLDLTDQAGNRASYSNFVRNKKKPVPMPSGVKHFSIWSLKNPTDDTIEKNDPYWYRMDNQTNKSLNEGLFKDIEQTIIDQDDPDYVEKDRERMFNNFKDAEQQKIKSVIEEWIGTYVTFYSDQTPATYILLKSVNKYLLNNFADWRVDNDGGIHLLSNVNDGVFRIEYDRLIGGEPIIGELPYKIVECQGSLEVVGHLKSLKNFPDYISGYLHISDRQKNSDEFLSLKGCPQKIEQGCYMNNLNIASLEYGPKYVGGTFSVSGNALTSLEYCPEYVGKNFHADHNDIETLKYIPKTVGGNLNIKGNCLPTSVVSRFYYSKPNGIELNKEYDQFDQNRSKL